MTSTTKSSIPLECILLRPFEIQNNVVIFTEQYNNHIATGKVNKRGREKHKICNMAGSQKYYFETSQGGLSFSHWKQCGTI